MARVFIGVPTLNRPDLVLETIESIRRQSFTDYRVVVSDNGSLPETAAAVSAYVAALGDPRFSYFQQPVNAGEYGQGWFFFRQTADDDFLVILHDDDLLDPDYLDTAVQALDAEPKADIFAANGRLIDRDGRGSPDQTAAYLRHHGREGVPDGLFDVLTRHVMSGFTPISGTVFRTSALRASGFVDPDCHGNFPFECNVFLRLGDIGAKGWFAARELISVRYHQGSLRSTLHLAENPHVVRTMLKLFARRRYTGPVERRRRVLVSRLHRADAMISLRQGNLPACRAALRAALQENLCSVKAAGAAALAWTLPSILKALLPPEPQFADVPPPSIYAPPPA